MPWLAKGSDLKCEYRSDSPCSAMLAENAVYRPIRMFLWEISLRTDLVQSRFLMIETMRGGPLTSNERCKACHMNILDIRL